MLFTSFEYLYLVIITMVLYYAPPLKRAQVIVLIVSSFSFYAYNKPILLFLLVFSVILFAFFSYVLRHISTASRKEYLAIGVAAGIGILAFFKYGSLITQTFLIPIIGEKNSIVRFVLTVPLPIGISFFTFEGVNLLVDTFRVEDASEKSYVSIRKKFVQHLQNTALFITFFPHLIAGPIIKAHDFFPQIETKYFKNIDWNYAFKKLILGYFLKMVIADNLKDQTFWMAYPYFMSLSSTTLLALLYAYSIQIFADFAGYSLIALGTASLFGYRLPVNFNFPYIATSFSEFWQRWHIALSTWLKTYLYIPLGGNRKGSVRLYFNIMTVMFLGGLWHGAGWNYAVWGTWHGFILTLERIFGGKGATGEKLVGKAVRIFLVFSAVTVAWLLFKLTKLSHVFLYFGSMASNFQFRPRTMMVENILIFSAPVILYHAMHLLKTSQPFIKTYQRFDFVLYGLMLLLILTNSGSSSEFIYFQF